MMIAMQYTIPLPADYDMGIIDRRIREKGAMLDGFPHLRFKAYLSARKRAQDSAFAQNLYAPFYLWDDAEGLNQFLCGQGFAVLSGDFGRPAVQTWSVWHAALGPDLRSARFASRKLATIGNANGLSRVREIALDEAGQSTRQGAIAVVTAFDPGQWTLLEFALWQARPPHVNETQIYDVGYVALP